MTHEYIITKALRCIDEVYPEATDAVVQHFPLEDFVDEACRRILLAAPLRALPAGADFGDAPLTDRGDGSGTIILPADFLRLRRLRMQGWQRPVTDTIGEDAPQYKLQFDYLTRGGAAKPVAALVDGRTRLEYYSLPPGAAHIIADARYIPIPKTGEDYPVSLADAAAWMLAALVLQVSGETEAGQRAQERAEELLGLSSHV